MNSEKVNERFQSHFIYGPRLIQIIANYVNHERLMKNLSDKSLSGESLENLSKFFAASFFPSFFEIPMLICLSVTNLVCVFIVRCFRKTIYKVKEKSFFAPFFS